MQIEGKEYNFKGSFVMNHPVLFRLDFGGFRYEGLMPKGTSDNLRKSKVKEIVFEVTNQIVPTFATNNVKMDKFTVTGIKDIKL
ncbi:MAG TPA: hypothetical protein GX497_17075 [Bacillus bacterium]|nr:hypothetical protein [Bacillus sp. (in: firmicutes)]